jgi:hypothetical protein
MWIPPQIAVSNTPATATDNDLTFIFGKFGTVLSLTETSQSAPSGLASTRYVTMDSPGAVTAAVRALNGTLIDGVPMEVCHCAMSPHSAGIAHHIVTTHFELLGGHSPRALTQFSDTATLIWNRDRAEGAARIAQLLKTIPYFGCRVTSSNATQSSSHS